MEDGIVKRTLEWKSGVSNLSTYLVYLAEPSVNQIQTSSSSQMTDCIGAGAGGGRKQRQRSRSGTMGIWAAASYVLPVPSRPAEPGQVHTASI